MLSRLDTFLPAMKWPLLRFNVHHLALVAVMVFAAGMIWAGWSAWWGLPACAILVAVICDAIARPTSSLFYPTVTHGARGVNCVALTFDDGPDPQTTPQVLDALAANGTRATFFVIGRLVERHPQLVRRMVDEGHVLGNHSWQHSRGQNFRGRRWQRDEINRGQQAISRVSGGAGSHLYRAPMGLKIGALCHELWRQNLVLVAWSLHSHDTRLDSAEVIASRVLARVRGGDIILLHDGHDLPDQHRPHCVEAVKLILQGLQEKGLDCVTVPELLARGKRQSSSGQPARRRRIS